MSNKTTKHDEIVDQLDQFYTQAKRQILQNQSAITGLFPSNSAETSSASIKTSLWSASSIFALYLAYSKRVDNDQGKAHDLGQSVVKCMRGILFAWMRQSEKVEAFKANQSAKHALHLKFDLHSGLANDFEYPHLQIDVVSLYLIFLANFIASGLDIIYCMDEVTFIQNLVYYVERAYRTPDFGNWEPTLTKSQQQLQQQSSAAAVAAAAAAVALGNAANTVGTQMTTPSSSLSQNESTVDGSGNRHHHQQQHQHSHSHSISNPEPINYHQPSGCVNCTHEGQPLEIHATSIGMAKSALESINGCNLFGGKGANWSIIYSDIDAHSRNRSIFETLLPRESRSKNTDSYLLATISWPCFATNDPVLYNSTKSKILRKLKGKYGLKRFLRDPYGTTLGSPQQQISSHASMGTPASSSADLSSQNCSTMGPAGGDVAGSSLPSPINLKQSGGVGGLNGIPGTPISIQQPQHQQSTPYANNNSVNTSGNNGGGQRQEMIRESSFGSNTSSSSMSYQMEHAPRTKQRKSSYYQRKNFFKTGASYQSHETQTEAQQLIQRTDSASKMSKRFEHIESEWPLFVCFLIIDGIFKQDMEQIYENERLLYERLLKLDPIHGDYLMPKYYFVPQDLINNEKCYPETVERLPSAEGSSSDQLYLTGQAVLLTTRLLLAGLVHPNELDPLRRHMPSHDRPKRIGRYSSYQATSSDLVVQTVLIAESIRLQAMMANYGIQTQTPLEVEPVQIWSSAQLVKVYEYLGVNEKLGLKGRPSRPIGALGTSKLYRICGQTILCYPLIFEVSDFYLAQDMLLLIDDIQNELNFIGRYWRMSGRPTVCILIREEHLQDVHFRDLLDLLVQFKNGQLKKSGLRIKTGRLQNLISSSCIEHLDFLHLLPHEHLPQFKSFRQLVECPKQSLLLSGGGRRGPACSQSTWAQASGHPATKSRRLLCSASSNNLQAIEERETNSAGRSNGVGGGGDSGSGGDHYNASNTNNDQEAANSSQTALEEFAEQLDFNMSDAAMYRFNSLDLEQNYSTEPCQSIDFYECYKEAPTWPTLIELLRTCNELNGQSQLLAILREREGPKYCVDDLSVEDRLERVSQLACQARNWSVVRYCSAVLKRSVESLSPWLTSILVNGKQISLGTGPNEQIINNPLTPTEIHTLIYSTANTKNPCDAVLQQEIALYIGRLISTRPDYFDGILTIRVGNFMSAMRSYLTIKTNERKLKLQLQQQREHEEALAKLAELRQQQKLQQQQQQQLAADQNNHHQQNNNQQLLDLRIKVEPPTPPATQSQSSLTSGSSLSIGHNGVSSSSRSLFDLSSTGGSLQVPGTSGGEPTVAASGSSHQQHHHSLGGAPTSKPHHHRSHHRRSGHHSKELVARSLESLSPSDVRKLLVKVLYEDESMPISDRRQITGELCRVPKDFYDKVWSLLSCTNVGILIGGKMLRSIPVLTNMTQDDLNFALKVESMLSAIECPKLRQVNVELLMALHVILERNPEIRFESDPLDLGKIINLSLEKFRTDSGRSDYGLREFYCNTSQTAMLYTVRTVFDCLLPVKFGGRADCRLS